MHLTILLAGALSCAVLSRAQDPPPQETDQQGFFVTAIRSGLLVSSIQGELSSVAPPSDLISLISSAAPSTLTPPADLVSSVRSEPAEPPGLSTPTTTPTTPLGSASSVASQPLTTGGGLSGSPTATGSLSGSNTTASPPPSNNKSGPNIGAIVGGAIAGLVVLCVTVIVIIWVLRRHPKKSKQSPDVVTEDHTHSKFSDLPETAQAHHSNHGAYGPHELDGGYKYDDRAYGRTYGHVHGQEQELEGNMISEMAARR